MNHPARLLLFAGALASAAAADGARAASPSAWRQTAVLPAPEAFQAAAADGRFVYAVANAVIARYDRATGERVATSTGPARHLNSAFLHEGALYCAHSNYPQKPERSEIKALDLRTMELSTFHDFGESLHGSLTWAVYEDGRWWCNFAHYGDDNHKTVLVRFDDEWREDGTWTWPAEMVADLGRYSVSGGLFRDGLLLATGHDKQVLYRLKVPEEPGVLEYVDTLPAPFTGQGIAHDPKTGGLVGIHRARRQVVFAAAADETSLVLYNGKIVTVDAGFRMAEALAVRGDRIVAVGTSAEVRELAGPRTRLIDLEGRTVLPGLIDSHVHPTGAAMYEYDHPLPEMETIADVLRYVQSRAEALEDGEWISLRQVFITRLRDQRYPTRHELDQVAPKNPVVFSTGPDAALNSLALELSGIDRDFQVDDGGPGHIERDPETGEPTGILRSCTRFVKSRSSGRQATEADQYGRLRKLLADYNAVGITSIADRNTSDGVLRLYEKLRDNDELTCRVFATYSVNAQLPQEQIESRIRGAAAHPLHAYDNRLWLRGIKVFLDGGMLTGSAYMRRPWGVSDIYSITDPDYRGLLFIEPDKLRSIARLALENGLQPTAHAVGDGAVHALIDAYAEVDRELSVRDMRPCITHANFMSGEAIEKMLDLGVVADLQPAWLHLDGATLLRQFGEERLEYFQPYATLFEQGVVVGGGSDHMQKIGSLRSVNPYNPFLGMWITLTRQPRWMDGPLHPGQRLSREQAIRLYTINNAWLTFEEHEKGSLEPGKLADFIVLRQDVLTCPVDAVKEIEVDRTWLGGRQVHP